MVRFENRMKYYKRINRYSLFQVTLVYLPALAASVYNLWYTWHGRQVFWIDIECVAMSVIMSLLNVVVILRSQGEYIRSVFDVAEFAADDDAKMVSSYREKYLVDVAAKELANEISQNGYKSHLHKQKIAEMSNEQRKGTLRAIFDRLFVGKQVKVESEGFKLKHGRGLEVNDDLFTDDDLTG